MRWLILRVDYQHELKVVALAARAGMTAYYPLELQTRHCRIRGGGRPLVLKERAVTPGTVFLASFSLASPEDWRMRYVRTIMVDSLWQPITIDPEAMQLFRDEIDQHNASVRRAFEKRQVHEHKRGWQAMPDALQAIKRNMSKMDIS